MYWFIVGAVIVLVTVIVYVKRGRAQAVHNHEVLVASTSSSRIEDGPSKVVDDSNTLRKRNATSNVESEKQVGSVAVGGTSLNPDLSKKLEGIIEKRANSGAATLLEERRAQKEQELDKERHRQIQQQQQEKERLEKERLRQQIEQQKLQQQPKPVESGSGIKNNPFIQNNANKPESTDDADSDPLIHRSYSVIVPKHTVPIGQPPVVGNTGSRFGGTGEVCVVCGKKVFPMDKLSADEKIFHKTCFKCDHCKKTLSLGNYASLMGKYYCKPHFKQLFKEKGNYSEGFGAKKLTHEWAERQGSRIEGGASDAVEVEDVQD